MEVSVACRRDDFLVHGEVVAELEGGEVRVSHVDVFTAVAMNRMNPD